jgi:hypothetical protein
MEYNPLRYKPDDVKKLVLERCITPQEGLEMLMEMEDSALLNIKSFSVWMWDISINGHGRTNYFSGSYELQ